MYIYPLSRKNIAALLLEECKEDEEAGADIFFTAFQLGGLGSVFACSGTEKNEMFMVQGPDEDPDRRADIIAVDSCRELSLHSYVTLSWICIIDIYESLH